MNLVPNKIHLLIAKGVELWPYSCIIGWTLEIFMYYGLTSGQHSCIVTLDSCLIGTFSTMGQGLVTEVIHMRLNQHPVFSVLFHKFKRACLNISKIERLCAFELSLSCQSAMSSLKRHGARTTQIDVLIVSFWFVQLRTMTGIWHLYLVHENLPVGYLAMPYDALLITLMSQQTVTNLAVKHGLCTMTKY